MKISGRYADGYKRVRGAVAIAVACAVGALISGTANAERGSSPALLVGQVPGYSSSVANEEGYWYSRYSMMTLTMQSGLGVVIPMDQHFMSMVPQMIAAVGPTPNDPVMVPMNPALLQVVYAGGSPHYATAPTQTDFGTLRWVGGQPLLTTLAIATTITKELEWAKMFHRDAHFGQAGVDSFGSSQRFAGMLFATMVKAQLQAFQSDRGSYAASEVGDAALLIALSDGAGFYSPADEANNHGPKAGSADYPMENRYADPATESLFRRMAEAQFHALVRSNPTSARELSVGIQALVWYASIASDTRDVATIKAAVLAWGGRLAHESADGPGELAYKVRGLIEAGRVTGREVYLTAAASAFERMTARFDYVHGVLHNTRTLSVDDVGEIAGAFNAAQLWLGSRINLVRANTLFGTWWEGTVNLSGLEISSPAVNQMKGAYELLDPPGRGTVPQNVLDYRYPSVPPPEAAGGAHGIAPVLAASITWDPIEQTWEATDNRFDTAGAMHAATELMWFHSDEVNGFPTVTLR